LLATFLEKIFQNPEWGILIGFIFGFLGISLFLSVMDLFIISFNELRKDPGRALTSDYLVQNIIQISLGAYLAFFFGITTFVIFSLKNFY